MLSLSKTVFRWRLQEKLSRELHSVFGDWDRPCTPQDLNDLRYLDCCVKETLRLYPSVPAIMRTLTEDTRTGDYTIPAGTSVALLVYAMHRNPKVYADADRFHPERFQSEKAAGRHPYAYIPFSAGPRNCIGQKYAGLEIKVSTRLTVAIRKKTVWLHRPGFL